jgi:hypothetical protein
VLIHSFPASFAALGLKIGAFTGPSSYRGEKFPSGSTETPRRRLPGLLRLVAAGCLALAAAEDSFAQSAQITGRVTDPTGAVVSGAEIRVSHVGTTLENTSVTNDAGIYVLPFLIPGTYTMKVAMAGFKSITRAAIQLEVDQVARIDFTLEVGETTDSVTVSESAPLIQSESGAIGQVVGHKKVVDLPLNGRDFTQLATLTPGALAGGNNSTLGGGPTIIMNGMRPSKTAFLIDGVNATNQWVDGVVTQPSPDAIQEFKVQSNALSAEFGQGGGVVSIQLKSGTNEYHATLFEFLRNDRLDARNFFNPAPAQKGVVRQNQFGAAGGGPILKNKTFVFSDYQATRLRRASFFNTLVGTEKMRAGDFSDLSTPILDPATARPNPANPSATLKDPFPGNRIQASRLSRPALYFLENNFILPPNTPNGFFNRAATRSSDTDQFDVRADHQLRQGTSLFGSYSLQQTALVTPDLFPLSGGSSDDPRTQRVSLGTTHTFSPSLVNEARAGYTRGRSINGVQGIGSTNHIVQSGIGGYAETSASFPGLPGFSITGYGAINPQAFRPGFRKSRQYNLIDNVTWVRGSHSLKTGVDIRWFSESDENCAYCRSSFSFTGTYTGNGFADYMLGIPFQGNRSFPRNQVGIRRERSDHFYFQDDWKVTPRLTLNLGVRYELNHPPQPTRHGSAMFDSGLGKIVVGSDGSGKFDLTSQQLTQFVFPIFADIIVSDVSTGRKDSMRGLDRNDVAPRVGIAWRVRNDLVVRAGYGIFYGLQQVNRTASTLIASPPFLADERSVLNTTPAPAYDLTNFFKSFAVGAPSLQGPFAFQIERNMRTPYFQQWNFTLQKSLREVLSVETAYVASKGTKVEYSRPINRPLPGPGDVQARRPFPRLGDIFFVENSGFSSYQSFQAKAEVKSWRGLSFLASYALSKSIDNISSDPQGDSVQNALRTDLEKGPSDFDRRQRLTLSGNFALRFGKGITSPARYAVRDWEIGSILTLQSGAPFTPSISADSANVGATVRRPDRVQDGRLENRSLDRYYNVAAFLVPAPFTYGNGARNILYGPGFKNLDFMVMRNFAFSPRWRDNVNLQFRAEFFNFTNTPRLANPGNNIQTGTAGRITGTAGEARDIQLSLKLIF